MDQVIAIQKVLEKIDAALKSPDDHPEILPEIRHDLEVFLTTGVDFKVVVDALDDSIFITDKDGRVIYVNPAHYKNTGILPEEVLGRLTSEIIEKGDLFTGGATMDVLSEKKKVFRLATVTKLDPPQIGYTVGVPILDDTGELQQVVVSSRPILSLQSLHEDYDRFLREVRDLRPKRQYAIVAKGDVSSRLIGSSQALQRVWSTIELAAPTDATILITGESGVGKEIVADEIFRLSGRSNKPVVKVNCASIPANLLESELFGYEKGAFSGANAGGKQGLFELANGGTILLDEIGDMPMNLQVKLLRCIQNKKILRVGGTHPIDLDIRFIAATNSDLKKKVSEGTFRQDLFYRLNVIPISIPPLRERMNDLDDLCFHFTEFFAAKHGRHLNLSEKNMKVFRSYRWPGNVRELENVLEYLTICASGTESVNDDMICGILDIDPIAESAPAGTLVQSVENYEKQLIESVLRESSSLRDAGAKLGVNASTISRKIKQYGIEYPGSK